MTKDEALDLALEALEYIHEGANNQGPHTGISWRCVAVKAEPAIKAIRQARALDKKAENARELGLDYEPEERYTYGTPLLDVFTKPAPVQELTNLQRHEQNVQKFLAAQPAPVQEPVAWCVLEPWLSGKFEAQDCFSDVALDANVGWVPLYTTPPAAPVQEPVFKPCSCRWKGEEQVQQCTLHAAHIEAIHEWAERAKTAEAKLKEKNT